MYLSRESRRIGHRNRAAFYRIEYGSGTAPVSLALTRDKAEVIRGQLARGESPKGDRKQIVTAFKEMMQGVIRIKAKSSRNEKYRQQGAMVLRDKTRWGITVDDVARTLNPIWDIVPETADCRPAMRQSFCLATIAA